MRISCQAFLSHHLLWPRLRRLGAGTVYKYISHKFLRWFTVVFLGLASIFGLIALSISAGYTFAAGSVLLAGLMILVDRYWRLPGLTVLIDALWSFVATGLGVWRALKGERFRMWTPAASIRDGGGTPAS